MLFIAFTSLSKVMIMIHDMKQSEPFCRAELLLDGKEL